MLKNIKIDKRDFIPVLILFQNSLFLYLAIFFHSIGPLSWLRYTLFPILMVIATIISFDGIKKIHLYDYFYIGIVASIFIVHYFAFKENQEIIEENFWSLTWCLLFTYIYGRSVYGLIQRDEKNHFRILYYISIVTLLICIVYSFRTMSTGQNDKYIADKSDMATSYAVLPCAMILCWRSIREPNVISISLQVISIIYVTLLGTRGAFLCLLVFNLLGYLFVLIRTKRKLSIIFLSLSLFLIYYLPQYFLDILYDIASKLGLSTRVFDKQIEGELMVSESRDVLKDEILISIKESPYWGNGIFADRRIIDTYVHNIFYEFFLDFGIVFGALLLGVIFYIIIKAFRATNNIDIKMFIVILFIASIVKNYMSGSYLNEPMFYILIALCISILIEKKEENKENEGI